MTDEDRQLLKKIEAFSPYLTHILRRDPSLIEKIFDQGGYRSKKSPAHLTNDLKEKVSGLKDFQTFCLFLRHFKQEEIFRIAARDLGGLAGFRETATDLSLLAATCLQGALSFCLQNQAGSKNNGKPALVENGLVVLGLGKLGGLELNFSSDIDLIFLYQPSGNVWPSFLEQKEYLQAATRKIIQAMGALMEGDHVFRVDLGLRPGGKDSDLVISLDSALEYYQSSAGTWERMAFIKARALAGNIKLGKAFLKEIQPIVYRKFIDYTILADIRTLKQKILAETGSHLLKSDDIKLGPGGIREIEFIVQSLQMVFGGKIPSIREGNTLKAIDKLKDAKLIPREEGRLLSQAYIFLRILEHRLQMVHQRQTHSLPHQAEALEGIARVMPLKGPRRMDPVGRLIPELNRVRTRVRISFDNLLLANSPVSQERLVELLRSTRSAEDRERELKTLGFQQGNQAREIIETWNRKLTASPAPGRTFFSQLFPLLLGYCLQSVNPDQSLSFIDRFLGSIGGRTAILSMLLERNALAKEIVDLFAQSALMGRIFIQNPEMMDHLALQRTIGRPGPENGGVLHFLKTRGLGKGLEDKLSDLRRWKNGYFLGTALEEMAGRLGPDLASERLTHLADQVLIESTRLAEESLTQEVVHPLYPHRLAPSRPSPFCILGLGKLGGQELGYASDLDLIFVYSLKAPYLAKSSKGPSQPLRKGDKKWVTTHEYLVRLAQRLISFLSIPLKEGPGYTVDTRLRPSGSFGPLIVTLEAFQDYYRNQAQHWEKQALLKARVIVGPPSLNNQVREVIDEVLFHNAPPSEVREEMAHFRSRMEKERSGENKERFNPKLGYGGLTDIEFIAQYLQWFYGQADPEFHQTNTLKILKALKDKGHLRDEFHYLLREAYHFLTLLDHGLQLLYDRKGDPRTYSPEELLLTAKQNLMGLGETGLPSWDILNHYRKITEKVRSIFEQVIATYK
ncbi:MAG: bifunctional [glutamate--ammonia ligase]-adenylyl-L-tyrosine phosphorylase/[glutamate--ammonia-ligase] adenylyltransferase [Deltaproteobacteria bacterium]|nr:bifunctional [glutamate--ammonia ligase]-adenylyl-L-tyrosine phosphorylase/[glutamate--ammonia-ligase] adenylyltransferase [Deltaproteobacteria bacterium]